MENNPTTHIKRQVLSYDDLAAWYNDYFKANGTWPTSAHYADTLLRFLIDVSNLKLETCTMLDIACGGGFFLAHTESRFQRLYGCDISRVALAEAQQRAPKASFCLANGESLSYQNESFDVVTCLGSLEHFLNVDQALIEMHRVVRKSGLVLILVPTNPDWAIYDVQPTEVVMDPEEWRSLLAKHGLETVRLISTDDEADLRASSRGCALIYARPMN